MRIGRVITEFKGCKDRVRLVFDEYSYLEIGGTLQSAHIQTVFDSSNKFVMSCDEDTAEIFVWVTSFATSIVTFPDSISSLERANR